MFSWIVQKINSFVEVQTEFAKRGSVIGVLDIYGFEVFQVNRSGLDMMWLCVFVMYW